MRDHPMVNLRSRAANVPQKLECIGGKADSLRTSCNRRCGPEVALGPSTKLRTLQPTAVRTVIGNNPKLRELRHPGSEASRNCPVAIGEVVLQIAFIKSVTTTAGNRCQPLPETTAPLV